MLANDDLFIQHHENLINRYMDCHPGSDWTDAYDATAQEAYDTYADYMKYMYEFFLDGEEA
jgi:hypothetical protein